MNILDKIFIALIKFLFDIAANTGAKFTFYYEHKNIAYFKRNIHGGALMRAIQGMIDSDIHDELGWHHAMYEYSNEQYTDLLRGRFTTIQDKHNSVYPGGPIGMVQLSTESDEWRTEE